MRIFHWSLTALVSLFLSFGNAQAQEFTDDPQGAIEGSISLAQQAFDEPLIFEGLRAVVFRYNRARLGSSPAGYEDREWLDGGVVSVFSAVDEKFSSVAEASPLPAEDVATMLEAYSENRDAYFEFYSRIQSDFGFQDISPERMLTYLSAYSVVTNSVDPQLWDAISSITGVWPLCFWQG